MLKAMGVDVVEAPAPMPMGDCGQCGGQIGMTAPQCSVACAGLLSILLDPADTIAPTTMPAVAAVPALGPGRTSPPDPHPPKRLV